MTRPLLWSLRQTRPVEVKPTEERGQMHTRLDSHRKRPSHSIPALPTFPLIFLPSPHSVSCHPVCQLRTFIPSCLCVFFALNDFPPPGETHSLTPNPKAASFVLPSLTIRFSTTQRKQLLMFVECHMPDIRSFACVFHIEAHSNSMK